MDTESNLTNNYSGYYFSDQPNTENFLQTCQRPLNGLIIIIIPKMYGGRSNKWYQFCSKPEIKDFLDCLMLYFLQLVLTHKGSFSCRAVTKISVIKIIKIPKRNYFQVVRTNLNFQTRVNCSQT